MRSVLLFFFLISFGTNLNDLHGQKTWTLEECLNYALDNNIQFKQTNLGTEFAEIDLEQSKYNRYPSVNGGITQQFNFGRSIDPTSYEFVQQTTPITALNLSANMDVFTGFRNKYTIERNEIALKEAGVQEQIQENNIGLSVVSAYLDVLNAQEQIKVLKEQAQITVQQKDRTEKLIRAGVLPKADILTIESQIANEEVNLVNAENMLALAQLNLAQIMNYEGIPNVVVPSLAAPSLAELERMNVETIYREALKKLPEMQSATMQEEMSKKDVLIAESGKYPNVSLFGGASTNFAGIKIPTGNVLSFNIDTIPAGFVAETGQQVVDFSPTDVKVEEKITPLGTQFKNNFSYNLGLNVSVPIFNRFQVKNNIARSQLSVKNAELQTQQIRNNLRQTIQQAYQAARMAAKTYESTQKTITALEQNAANLKKRYELGASTALEYQTAQNDLAVAKLNLNSAKFDYIFRLKILDFYQGREITF